MSSSQLMISTIIPVYNGEAFLSESIRSVLAQRWSSLEIIVVDDGSTDATPDITASFGSVVRYVRQSNAGPASARNRGLALASGHIIAFVDADDRWTEMKLQSQLPYLASNPQTEIVLGYSQRIARSPLEPGNAVYKRVGPPVFYLSLGSALIRRSTFEKVGVFDETLVMGEEVDWYLRANELGVAMEFHQDITQLVRRHEHNMTRQRDLTDRQLVNVFKRSLDRRRHGGKGLAPGLSKWFDEATFPGPSRTSDREARPMKPEAPFVSVIIPVYNGEAYVVEAVESIRRQHYHPLEIITVDDGSTDGTARIISTLQADGLRYVHQTNAGAAGALNTGLRLAQGDLITFLDADDIWTDTKLGIQVPHLIEHPEVEVVLGYQQRMWSSDGNELTPPELALSLQSCVFRRSVFDKVGVFDSTLRYHFGWDWFMKARELGVLIVKHPEVMSYYRRHDTNMTLQLEASNKEFALMLKRSVDRRRRVVGRPGSLADIFDLAELPDVTKTAESEQK